MIVPVCPGRLGLAAVDVRVNVPEYVEVIVVKLNGNWGTWIMIVPVCPGEVGTAAVEVRVKVPE
jgi:hypothetical protein